jgi:hypothetical protein
MMQCERSLNIRRGGENKIELTKKEKDRLAELKAKEVKDQKSLTEAEKAELKPLSGTPDCGGLCQVPHAKQTGFLLF